MTLRCKSKDCIRYHPNANAYCSICYFELEEEKRRNAHPDLSKIFFWRQKGHTTWIATRHEEDAWFNEQLRLIGFPWRQEVYDISDIEWRQE